MIVSVLNDTGIKSIDQAEDGEEAWGLLEKKMTSGKPYDLIFLDWNMPNLDGLGLLQRCRADARYKNIPIVMVTAESERPFILKALSSGATDYIVKPFSGNNLKEKLAALNARLNKK
jgi:two-component system chemotaxis response regulator CheY